MKQIIQEFCLSMPHATEDFPFDDKVWVGKIHNKIFILMDIFAEETAMNLKCDPDYAEELRAQYDCIKPGWHMNKKHWNTVTFVPNEVDVKFLKELIQHSYDLVLKSVPKKIREAHD
jgi:predicted DNA-binding protein (MmcQ/YjbR family)